jgi:hypothetical protein
VTTFEPRAIPVPLAEGESLNWTGWREAMREHIAEAQTEIQLSAITDLNQQSLSDCCERGPNSYRLICDALDRRRVQIERGLPWSGQ